MDTTVESVRSVEAETCFVEYVSLQHFYRKCVPAETPIEERSLTCLLEGTKMPVDEAALLTRRTAAKVEAIVEIEAALAETAAGPDGWQRLHLAQAISWLWRGAYDAAKTNASLALVPASERVAVTDPVTESFTTTALRQALTQVRAEPVRLHPALGPIIYTGD